jgi:hypothetical protein
MDETFIVHPGLSEMESFHIQPAFGAEPHASGTTLMQFRQILLNFFPCGDGCCGPGDGRYLGGAATRSVPGTRWGMGISFLILNLLLDKNRISALGEISAFYERLVPTATPSPFA